MKRNHLTYCLVGIAAAAVLLVVFGVKATTIVYLAAVLACPLMMVFMMRGMMHGDGHGDGDQADQHHTGTGDRAGRPR